MGEFQIPRAFFWRRIHSIMGLWLVIFLIEHLLTNSQSALWIGDDGRGYIHAVNSIQALPYLKAIEVSLLGVPFLIHIVWGIKYLWTGKMNSFPTDGSSPSLTKYPRNHAYSWQRITSWILVIGVIAHVVHMRFVEYPTHVQRGDQEYYIARVSRDQGLYPLAARLGVQIIDNHEIQSWVFPGTIQGASRGQIVKDFFVSIKGIFSKKSDKNGPQKLILEQEQEQNKKWIEALQKQPLGENQVIIVAKSFGAAELFIVRNAFKMPVMIVLYTLFVLASTYHGFNGLWSFLITWGVSLTESSQRIMRKFATFLMILISFLGFASIWLTYWVNLYD